MAVLRQTLRSSRRLWIKACLCSVLLLLGKSAATAATPEYQLKAIFLFNFTQFVEWPPQAFTASNSPLIIGVLGTDPFGSYLDDTVRGEIINGRPLAVERYATLEAVKNCHILFISRSESARQAEILRNLKGREILTVGETEGFVNAGGIIRFVTIANKIRLRIGLAAAQEAQLELSSKLLRPADIVTGGGE